MLTFWNNVSGLRNPVQLPTAKTTNRLHKACQCNVLNSKSRNRKQNNCIMHITFSGESDDEVEGYYAKETELPCLPLHYIYRIYCLHGPRSSGKQSVKNKHGQTALCRYILCWGICAGSACLTQERTDTYLSVMPLPARLLLSFSATDISFWLDQMQSQLDARSAQKHGSMDALSYIADLLNNCRVFNVGSRHPCWLTQTIVQPLLFYTWTPRSAIARQNILQLTIFNAKYWANTISFRRRCSTCGDSWFGPALSGQASQWQWQA